MGIKRVTQGIGNFFRGLFGARPKSTQMASAQGFRDSMAQSISGTPRLPSRSVQVWSVGVNRTSQRVDPIIWSQDMKEKTSAVSAQIDPVDSRTKASPVGPPVTIRPIPIDKALSPENQNPFAPPPSISAWPESPAGSVNLDELLNLNDRAVVEFENTAISYERSLLPARVRELYELASIGAPLPRRFDV